MWPVRWVPRKTPETHKQRVPLNASTTEKEQEENFHIPKCTAEIFIFILRLSFSPPFCAGRVGPCCVRLFFSGRPSSRTSAAQQNVLIFPRNQIVRDRNMLVSKSWNVSSATNQESQESGGPRQKDGRARNGEEATRQLRVEKLRNESKKPARVRSSSLLVMCANF
jgi:hypothetical protein